MIKAQEHQILDPKKKNKKRRRRLDFEEKGTTNSLGSKQI